ncbi:glutamate--cysteine ligase chloroplastic [Prunus yedoensis var. nudiflora]|uniref:Glutamate--cysteine ligase n=1 Tax=Prunus yedoensis var. nudiflora TaxID=2094558 RepID=A0A314UBW1_PRUYE|nr:glutamate--cysteine ligase chloroplastic [Prunus yedoensis var. nudiflora]
MALISQTSYCIVFSSLLSYTASKTHAMHVDNAEVGQRRRRCAIVAASPPTEAAVIAAEPLTKEDLIGYLASGCKPKENWRIGTEQERFGFDLKTLRPMKYEHIAELLNGIADRFDWDKIMEGNNIIALKQGKQSITLEPGGQFEHSGAPLETLHQVCAEVNSHLYQVKAVLKEMGIGLLDIGCQPKWEVKDIPMMPKERYEIIRNYMPKVGLLGLDLMFRTCTAQVNLDFSSEADMIKKLRASIALQPYFLHRFEKYVEYALDIPMYFVYRNKRHFDCTGMTFRDFMAGKLHCIPGELPTMNDWEMHLGTIYPEVGLLYDEVSLQNVLDMTADWTAEERQMLRDQVPKTGLKTPFRGRLLKHVAQDVVQFAKAGLERRGFNETGFLNELAR